MTEIQKQNVANILRKAQGYIAEAKKAASVGEAIAIANLEGQIGSFFRNQGIETEGSNRYYTKLVFVYFGCKAGDLRGKRKA